MPLEPHVKEQVAGRSLADAWLPLARQADDRALSRSRRNRDLDAHWALGPRQLDGAAPAPLGRFKAQADFGVDIAAGHAEAGRTAAAAEEPLEELAEPLLPASTGIRTGRLPARR